MCNLLELATFFEKRVGDISGGYKRILSIALALIGTSRIIVLDEPTANLDLQARLKVWKAIDRIKEGRTLIISTQIVEEAEMLCDKICFMKEGRILQVNSP